MYLDVRVQPTFRDYRTHLLQHLHLQDQHVLAIASCLAILQTGNIIAYLWNFGGTDTSNLQNPIVSFTTPGVHPVTML